MTEDYRGDQWFACAIRKEKQYHAVALSAAKTKSMADDDVHTSLAFGAQNMKRLFCAQHAIEFSVGCQLACSIFLLK